MQSFGGESRGDVEKESLWWGCHIAVLPECCAGHMQRGFGCFR